MPIIEKVAHKKVRRKNIGYAVTIVTASIPIIDIYYILFYYRLSASNLLMIYVNEQIA